MTPFRFQGLLEKKQIHVPLVTEMDAPLGVCLARLRHLVRIMLDPRGAHLFHLF